MIIEEEKTEKEEIIQSISAIESQIVDIGSIIENLNRLFLSLEKLRNIDFIKDEIIQRKFGKVFKHGKNKIKQNIESLKNEIEINQSILEIYEDLEKDFLNEYGDNEDKKDKKNISSKSSGRLVDVEIEKPKPKKTKSDLNKTGEKLFHKSLQDIEMNRKIIELIKKNEITKGQIFFFMVFQSRKKDGKYEEEDLIYLSQANLIEEIPKEILYYLIGEKIEIKEYEDEQYGEADRIMNLVSEMENSIPDLVSEGYIVFNISESKIELKVLQKKGVMFIDQENNPFRENFLKDWKEFFVEK